MRRRPSPSGAGSTHAPMRAGSLVTGRPNASPKKTIARQTTAAALETRPRSHAKRSASSVPTRNTTSAGTSRLRYEPTGSSTVTRSFHPVTTPRSTSTSGDGQPRRIGPPRRHSHEHPEHDRRPGRREGRHDARPRPESRCGRDGGTGERGRCDDEQEPPGSVDRPRGDRRDHDHRRHVEGAADDAGGWPPAGVHDCTPRSSSAGRSSMRPIVRRVSEPTGCTRGCARSSQTHGEHGGVGREGEGRLPDAGQPDLAIRTRRTRSRGHRMPRRPAGRPPPGASCARAPPAPRSRRAGPEATRPRGSGWRAAGPSRPAGCAHR